jgi:hypothetical protein
MNLGDWLVFGVFLFGVSRGTAKIAKFASDNPGTTKTAASVLLRLWKKK